MRHAREDYNRIQDPDGKIPKLEPVFLIRGQDIVGSETVRVWADLAEQAGADAGIVDRARKHADLMDAWNEKKVPDYHGEDNTNE